LDALKARLKAAGLTAEGASAQTQRTAIVRSIEGLCRKENVQFHGDFVWICGQPKPPAHKAHKGAQDEDVVRPVNRGAQAHTQTPPSKNASNGFQRPSNVPLGASNQCQKPSNVRLGASNQCQKPSNRRAVK